MMFIKEFMAFWEFLWYLLLLHLSVTILTITKVFLVFIKGEVINRNIYNESLNQALLDEIELRSVSRNNIEFVQSDPEYFPED